MKDALNFLKELSKKQAFNPSFYYSITIIRSEINFQGKYCSVLASRLKKQGISLKLDQDSNFIEGKTWDKKGLMSIRITLT